MKNEKLQNAFERGFQKRANNLGLDKLAYGVSDVIANRTADSMMAPIPQKIMAATGMNPNTRPVIPPTSDRVVNNFMRPVGERVMAATGMNPNAQPPAHIVNRPTRNPANYPSGYGHFPAPKPAAPAAPATDRMVDKYIQPAGQRVIAQTGMNPNAQRPLASIPSKPTAPVPTATDRMVDQYTQPVSQRLLAQTGMNPNAAPAAYSPSPGLATAFGPGQHGFGNLNSSYQDYVDSTPIKPYVPSPGLADMAKAQVAGLTDPGNFLDGNIPRAEANIRPTAAPAPIQQAGPSDAYLAKVMGSYNPNSPVDQRKAEAIRQIYQPGMTANQVYANPAYAAASAKPGRMIARR